MTPGYFAAMLPPLLEAYGRWTVRRRWVALALCGLLTVMALGLIAQRLSQDRLPVDFTPQVLFMDSTPALERMEAMEETFGREDNDLVLIVQGLRPSAEAVESLTRLHRTMLADPRVERVDSVVNAQLVEAEAGGLRVYDPLRELAPDQAFARLAADPVLGGLVMARDGSTTALRVRIEREREKIVDLAPAVHELVEAARSVPLPAGASLTPIGVPWVRVEVVDLLIGDQARFLPMVALLFAITVVLLFGRVRLGLAPLVAVLLADLWAIAVLLAGGVTFNVLSMLVPTLVVVIGSSDGIHLASRYREELAQGDGREAAMGRTVRRMSVACFLTTFTTAAGFASLVMARTSVVRDFGVHSAVAVLVTWLAVMLALPSMLALIPEARVLAAARPGRPPLVQRALAAVDQGVRRRPGAVLVAALAISAVAAIIGGSARPDSNLMEMYLPGSTTSQAMATVEEKLGGVVPVFFHISGEPGAALAPRELERIQALEAQLRAQAPVLWSTSIAAHIAQIHSLLTGAEGLPSSGEAVAQELLLAELSDRQPFEGLLDEDRSQTRILALVADSGGRSYRAMQDRLAPAVEELFADSALTVELTGDGIMASEGLLILVRDLLGSLALVFVVILITLWLLLRDLRLALVAALPNVVPLVFTLAVIAMAGADLRATNIVTFTVAIGLAVDDTIHFIVRYRQERLQGQDVQAAISRSFHGAGHAIVLTSLLLVMGFGVLTTSQIATTRIFGVLTAVTVGAALLADLLLLPALLHIVGRRRWSGWSRVGPVTPEPS
jgi:predicted RND superfamily exporter protein